MKSEYDVIVVGAGPGGSLAAKTAAEQGLDVLLIEKRQEIGDPVRCAEGVGKAGLQEFVEPDPKWISADIKCARIFSPDGTMVELSEKMAGNEVGFVLERKIFDRELAKMAAKAGAEVQVKTQATGLIIENGQVCGITGKRHGDEFTARAKVVVAADGVESKVGRWAGINTTLKMKDIETCAQFLMTDINIKPNSCDFYLGSKYAPGGYVWVFPKGDREANVGLGMLASHYKGKHPIEYLREFVADKFPEGKILETVVGAVPVSGMLPKLSTGGLVLVGDAGHVSDPITGGGIINAMSSGRIAGNIIANCIRAGDVSAKALSRYDAEVREALGKSLDKNYKIKEVVTKVSDNTMNVAAHSLQGVDFENVTVTKLVKEIVTRNPALLKELVGLI
ncbi:NAD(P)/FAD-dependent oxidoreductase [Methanocella arvoryzae]|uniref:Digeranylgeranylglycerophospholipid reductase n=1 Tax=Methanocella arvoryzae (strain DSM 22066 / NBRC 105507 / MRE50) TaxID=351160 RepID=GGR_METAR|nr:NAD(P)/FAD-dependent oxidoreductase [Methanocella arvoryzae]Q0W349.1 RecName: Full=Digeranylgeranylglycerophospholipid reductase; Short=DGGGPL reductase; AltName: Full=2,3-bis-O-geranylgeranylglyceryl phosphate reductase; AltName: Full=Geranylgeranyl reductase; Short=GGR [Methanocella arvoryzae MRE50]CAJ37194.1 putative geranylgeranyl reductase [Methanocella arvoryzae MRE50]